MSIPGASACWAHRTEVISRRLRSAGPRPSSVARHQSPVVSRHSSVSVVSRISYMNWFVRGDIDGFFGLALDNLVQLLLIDALCRFVLGLPPDLVFGRILPGAAVSILVG